MGFDLAGPEAGYPPDDRLPACRIIRGANLGLTIQAGEADGPDSMWRALQRCGAHCIGHGIHIKSTIASLKTETSSCSDCSQVTFAANRSR